MNELQKYATFSVDLLGTPKRINRVFSMGRARIFYKGMNQNRSIIDGEVADQVASTIAGTPVIGCYNYETQDFEGHEDNQSAFGFIPLEPHMAWVKYTDTNGEHEYLEVDVVIWDGRFDEAKKILNSGKHLSMELNPKTMKGAFERVGSHTYYRITYAEFAGITVLGEGYEPCFEGAQFITAYSKMISAYALYVEEAQRNIEGGKYSMEDNIEIVEPEVTTEAVVEESVEEVINTEFTEVVEAADDAEETEVVETVETPAATEYAQDEEVCDKCGKNPCVCECAAQEDDEEADDKDDAEQEDEDKECSENYQALEAQYADLQAKYESLENKYNEALNSLNLYSKKEKLEIISKFSTKIESEELIERLTNEVDNYSLEEIKGELGQALVEQLNAEDDVEEASGAETNFSLNINIADNTLGNSAWDLVRRHKEGK